MLETILIVSILAGELIKFPLSGNEGPILLDLSVGLLCLLGIYHLKGKFKKPNLSVKFGVAFIIVSILSLILTPLYLTTTEYLISLSYTLRFTLYLFLFYLINIGAFPNLKNTSKILLLSGIGVGILGLLQFIFFPNLSFLQPFGWDPHYFRTVSTFLDPNFAGAFFVLTLLLLVQNFSKDKKWYLYFFIIVYLALLNTFSRSSYVMFLVSGITYSFFKKSKTFFVYTIILFIILLIGFQLYSQLVAKPRGINREQSASYRIDTWQDGLIIFQKSPFLGVGFNAYKYAIKQYQLSDEQFLKSRGSSTNDSSLLYVLSTTGTIGFIIYILFLSSFVKEGFKKNKLLVAAMIGLIIHSLFANSLFYPFILIWIFLKAIDKDHLVS